MTYTIRLASESDLDAMMALRSEAERWMEQAGIEQWVPLHSQQSRRLLVDSVRAAEAWVVTEGSTGHVVATASLKGPDLDYWTEADGLDDAVYIYKIIVARSHSGRDLGGAILDWASRRAEEEGRRWLRLDCRRDNVGLHAFYLRHGFELVRIMDEPLRPTELPRYTGALFQRPAGVQTSATEISEGEIDPEVEKSVDLTGRKTR